MLDLETAREERGSREAESLTESYVSRGVSDHAPRSESETGHELSRVKTLTNGLNRRF